MVFLSGADPLTTVVAPDVKRAIALAWLLSLGIDRLSFPQHLTTAFGAVALLVAGVALLKPAPQWAAAALLIDAMTLASHMPDLGNHLVLRLFIDLVVAAWLLGWNAPIPSMLRLTAILLYTVAVTHKINSSFLDPEVSCARFISDRALSEIRIPTGGAWLAWSAISVTFLAEAGIPVLLLARRSRRLGLFVGIIFHTALAVVNIAGVASFSVFMLACYVAFLNPATLRRIATLADNLADKASEQLRFWLWPSLAISAAVLVFIADVAPSILLLAARLAAVVLGLLMGWLVLKDTTPTDHRVVGGARTTSAKAALLITGVVLLAAGAQPYLGGRTQASFSMFSNIRTETEPNHLFLPSYQWFGYQDDLVNIDDEQTTLLDGLGAGELVVPAYEVGRRLDGRATGVLVYQDATGTHELDQDEAAFRFPPPTAVEGFLFRMREIEPSGPVACSH